jgi:hypothetical protein
MAFVSLLMIPSWPAAFMITAAIISIDIGWHFGNLGTFLHILPHFWTGIYL